MTMDDTKALLITQIIHRGTTIDLYGKGHNYRDLILFDPYDLEQVGIRPGELALNQETPCRFWAHYRESAKLNSKGNPYKDVVYLAPFVDGNGAEPTAAELTADPEPGQLTDALLDELAAIRGLVAEIRDVLVHGATQPPPEPAPAATPATGGPNNGLLRYQNGTALGEKPAEIQAFARYYTIYGTTPADVDHLRAWVRAGMPLPR